MANLKSQPAGKSRALQQGDGDAAIRKYITELRAIGGGRISCGSGLSIRVYPESAKYCLSWMPPRRPGEKREPQRTAVLGDTGKMSLTKARAEAEELRERIAGGFDPIATKRASRATLTGDVLARRAKEDASAKALANIIGGAKGDYSLLANATARDACDVFMRVAVTKAKKKSRDNTARELRDFIDYAGVAALPPSTISASMIENFISECGPGKAFSSYNSIKRWLRWLCTHKAIAGNECEKVPKPPRPKPRDTVYEAAHIKALWNCPGLKAEKLAYLQFLLLTPLRRGETTRINIEDIKKGASGFTEIVITGDRTKNGDPLRIPLTGDALRIVLEQKGDRETGRLFHAGDLDRLANAIRTKGGVENFDYHDNRRTFTTVSVDLELAVFDVIDAMLNHRSSDAKSGTRAHYNKSAGIPARARLLARWGEVIAYAAQHGEWPAPEHQGENIISLKARRA